MTLRAYDFTVLEPAAPVSPDGARQALLAADAERSAAREHARQEGFAAGRAEALAALEPAAAALAAATAAVREEAAVSADALEQRATELALEIAEKVLAGTLSVEPERVLDAVRGALRGIADRSRVTVLVAPDDLELVQQSAAGIQQALGGIDVMEVQGERRVAPGGAIVRHAEGAVDASVAAKLERVRELIAGG